MAQLNRLVNIAFGHNSVDDAKAALRLLLADELKAEKKAAKATPKALAKQQEKQRAAKEKRKKTNAANLEIKIQQAKVTGNKNNHYVANYWGVEAVTTVPFTTAETKVNAINGMLLYLNRQNHLLTSWMCTFRIGSCA
jgi:outer membrane protein W